MIRFLTFCIVILSSNFSQAQNFNYFDPQSIDAKSVLAAPPSAMSPEAQIDLAAVLQAQNLRSSLDCTRARSEIVRSTKHFFGPPFGPLTEVQIQKVNEFLSKVESDTQVAEEMAKASFQRPRPFVTYPKQVQPCPFFELPHNTSYPSGHSLEAHVTAKVLDLIFADQKLALDARADQIAQDRVIAGVHYPTDIQAGKKLADSVFAALNRSPNFQKDLNFIISK